MAVNMLIVIAVITFYCANGKNFASCLNVFMLILDQKLDLIDQNINKWLCPPEIIGIKISNFADEKTIFKRIICLAITLQTVYLSCDSALGYRVFDENLV